jgi:Dullard-like phosphatase family protein
MIFEDDNIFYYSNNISNKNIGFSSSSNYNKKKAISFTPIDINHLNQNNEINLIKSKSFKERENSMNSVENETDSSFDFNEEYEVEKEEEKKEFKRKKVKNQTLALDLFNKNFDLLYNKITETKKKNLINEDNEIVRRKNRSTSMEMNELIKKIEDKIQYFNNTENINDFYEYTEICFEHISKLEQKPRIKEFQYINLNFSEEEKNKKIALLDLDETLIHCIGEINKDNVNKNKCDKIIDVILPSKKKVTIGINIRPHLFEAMDIIKEKYNIVIFTASHSSYTDAILKEIDPENKYFKNRLYRNNCIPIKIDGKNFYVKDLDILKKYHNLKDCVIIDNSVLSFAYHLNNGIPIIPYYDTKNDSELIILAYYLSFISNDNDLRKSNKKHLKLKLFLEEAQKIINGEIIEDISDDDDDLIITENNTYIFMNEENHDKRINFIKLVNHYHHEYMKIVN